MVVFPLSSAEQLSCLGVIRKKLKVDATDDSYAKARQSMAQAEEETRSQRAIVIKDVGRDHGRCMSPPRRGNQRGLDLKVVCADAVVKNAAVSLTEADFCSSARSHICF